MRETGKYWTRKKASQLQIEITLKGSTEKKKKREYSNTDFGLRK